MSAQFNGQNTQQGSASVKEKEKEKNKKKNRWVILIGERNSLQTLI